MFKRERRELHDGIFGADPGECLLFLAAGVGAGKRAAIRGMLETEAELRRFSEKLMEEK